MQGYDDAKKAGKLTGGTDDFIHIHTFFRDSRLTLVGMVPEHSLVGDDPSKACCIHDDTTYIIYAANPSGDRAETDNAAAKPAEVVVQLPPQQFAARWYDPTGGRWKATEALNGGGARLRSPGPGDWVLLLRRTTPDEGPTPASAP
jgi:hypothetical protein